NSIKFDLYFKPILPFISIELYLKDAHQLVSSWYYGHVFFVEHWDRIYALQHHPNFTKEFLSVGD
ncbi:unnamed protein product, partial [Rotaria sp. Silwood2]